MNIRFTETQWERMTNHVKEYYDEIGRVNDAFHNGMLFGGTCYAVGIDGISAGFVSVSDGWDGGKMLTGFHLTVNYRSAAGDVLMTLIRDYDVRAALTATNDKEFCSVIMRVPSGTFRTQAYNYTYGEPDKPADFPAECLTEIRADELERLDSETDSQWSDCLHDPALHFYKLEKDGEILGYGAYCTMPFNEGYADIGNFTLPQYRRKGVGRSILIHLAQVVRSKGLEPVAGCWAGNMESIPTIRSAGFIPENKLCYVQFD